MYKSNLVLMVCCAIFLTACGGGSSNKSSSNKSSSDKVVQSAVTVSGAIEKGPFIIGSNITISRLNSAGQATDSTLTTQTTNDLGHFSVPYPKGALIQIKADGYYRNEITGALSLGVLSLRSIYLVSDNNEQKAHVNILTHLISNRVLALVSSGISPNSAISQATNEMASLLEYVATGPSLETFTSLGLYDNDESHEGNAYLALISSLFYQYSIKLAGDNSTNPDAELSLLLNELANDFSDGELETTDILESLKNTMRELDPIAIQEHLGEIAKLAQSNQKAADINLFLDSDLDGITNNEDEDDDNDGKKDNEDDQPYKPNFVVKNLSFVTKEDQSLSFTLESNNPHNSNIDYTITQNPKFGTISGTFPSVIYRPNNNYFGIDTIRLRLSQIGVTSKEITLTINIHAENDAPVISGFPPAQIAANKEYAFKPIVSDIENSELSFSIENKPAWLTFSSTTGEIAGIPSNAQAGVYNGIVITVSDGEHFISLPEFNIEVTANPWSTLKELPVSSRGGAAAEYDGIIYYFGGTSGTMRSVYAYDIVTDDWSTRASMPRGIHDLDAYTVGNKIYIVSGYGDGGFVNDTLEYDPITDSWAVKKPRPTHRYIFSSAEVDGLIYVIGGQGTVDDGPWRSGIGWTYKNYVEIYNPKTDTWSSATPSPAPLASNCAVAIGDEIFVVGGSAGNGRQSAIYVYNTQEDSWALATFSMTSARERMSCGNIGDEIYVFGGLESSGLVSSVESLNTSTGVWASKRSMNKAKQWFPLVSFGEKTFVFGGQQIGNVQLRDVEVYEPSIDR